MSETRPGEEAKHKINRSNSGEIKASNSLKCAQHSICHAVCLLEQELRVAASEHHSVSYSMCIFKASDCVCFILLKHLSLSFLLSDPSSVKARL